MKPDARSDAVVAYIGLGSNLDDPRRQVLTAMEELDSVPSCRVTGKSSMYYSAPWGDAAPPDFINAVCRLQTRLKAGELLDRLLAIEARHRRERVPLRRYAPRTLDLDLLLYGDAQINRANLIVPHPEMHRRRFVLLPLSEIAPDARIPGKGPVRDLLLRGEAARQIVERLPAAH